MFKVPLFLKLSNLSEFFQVFFGFALWSSITFYHKGYHRYGDEYYAVIVVSIVLGILSSIRLIFKSREMSSKSEAIDMI